MVTTKERSFIATSISPVATIWQSAPSRSQGQNAGDGHGKASPVKINTPTKNRMAKGKPNRKRMLVAPHVPSGPVNCRCMALRATWPIAAVIVKGIQSEVTVNICEKNWGWEIEARHRAGRGDRGQPEPCMTALRLDDVLPTCPPPPP